MVGFLDRGSEVFDYGNSLRTEAKLGGFERAFDYPGFLPAYIRPLFCEGKGPFRWVALSGDPADIAATDRAVLEEFPDDDGLARWIGLAGERVAFQGLPARICWLGYGERHRLGLRFNEMVRTRRAVGADRDRARPPRLRLGRLALPRDRGHGRRLRRHRRLAAAQRPRQHRQRRHVGEHPPRRRRRASGARSTPAWCASPTAPTSPPRSSSGCSRPIPGMGVIRHADAGYERAARGRRRARRAHPDAEGAASRRSRPVTVRPIATVGHPVLRERARGGQRRRAGDARRSRPLIDDLIDTMRDANGAGLAANQVARAGADRGDRGRPQPPVPVQAADPPHRRRQPGHRAARRRGGRDQRGLPVGARTCGATCSATSTCGSATSTATASSTTR